MVEMNEQATRSTGRTVERSFTDQSIVFQFGVTVSALKSRHCRYTEKKLCPLKKIK